jgi:hypothetical protein
MAAIVNPGNPSTNRTTVKFNFHGKTYVDQKYFTPRLKQHTLHEQFEFMCQEANPQYWQSLEWTIDKGSTQQQLGPCGINKWKKIVRGIFLAALAEQTKKYRTEVVIHVDIQQPEPNMDTEHPEWMQKRWQKYMSKHDTLSGIDSLSHFSDKYSTLLIVIGLALTQSFGHAIARKYAIDLFKSILQDWEINPPHHDHTQIKAHSTLLYRLIRTLKRRARKKND